MGSSQETSQAKHSEQVLASRLLYKVYTPSPEASAARTNRDKEWDAVQIFGALSDSAVVSLQVSRSAELCLRLFILRLKWCNS